MKKQIQTKEMLITGLGSTKAYVGGGYAYYFFKL